MESALPLDLDPIAFSIGPFAVRWYGLLMAVSILIGFYYLRRDGMRLGHSEDFLYNFVFLMVVGGVIGARLVYVATNWGDYSAAPLEILRVDHGGLSFHGAVMGGALFGSLYARAKGKRVMQLFDLTAPGLAVGIVLVRIGNLINNEVLGRTTELGFDRHPAQLYASFLGLVLLVIHNVLARRRPPEGYLALSFILYYSILRGLIEETVRDNPLYWQVFISEQWGVGLFTLTHLVTVPIVLLAWWQRRRLMSRHFGSLRRGRL